MSNTPHEAHSSHAHEESDVVLRPVVIAGIGLLVIVIVAALAMFVAGVSFYMLHNSMQTEATELAPSARGSAVALFACGFFVGQALGPPIFAALLHGLGPRPALFVVAIVLVVLGRTVVARVIDRRIVAGLRGAAPR